MIITIIIIIILIIIIVLLILVVIIIKEQKISNYYKLKDEMPRHLQSNIVYSVKCLDCEAKYVGKKLNILKREFIN